MSTEQNKPKTTEDFKKLINQVKKNTSNPRPQFKEDISDDYHKRTISIQQQIVA